MKKEKVKIKGMGGILLFLIFTAGIGKSEVRIPNVGIGGGIFRSYNNFIGPEVNVRFKLPYNLGLEAKNVFYHKYEVLFGNPGEIKGLYFWKIGKFFSPYIGVGVESYFIEKIKLSPTCGIGVDVGLGNFSFSPEISLSKSASFRLSGYYYFMPKTEKKNPHEKKITYITTIGGAIYGLRRSIAVRLLFSYGSSAGLTYKPHYYLLPLISGGASGYITGELISSWVKKDEGLVSSMAKGLCSGLLGGFTYYLIHRTFFLGTELPLLAKTMPERSDCSAGMVLMFALYGLYFAELHNIALWTISGAVYGAIAR
jgi:opacity protein-like surface antigen